MNQYSELLNYLEKVPKKIKTIEAIKPVVIEIQEKNTFDEFSKLDNGMPSFDKKININISKFFDIQLFEDKIKDKIIEKYETSKLYDRPYISISEIIGCDRKIYFDRKKYSYNKNKLISYPLVDLLAFIGNAVHEYLQKLYPYSETEKTIISKKYKIKGRVDAILDNVLFEIKTIDAKLSNIKEIRKKDFDQANIYVEILNEEYGYNINNIVIIYVTRDLKKIIPLDIIPDKNAAIKILKKSNLIYDSLNKNLIPEYNIAYKDDCKYCQFEEHCVKHKTDKKNIFLL